MLSSFWHPTNPKQVALSVQGRLLKFHQFSCLPGLVLRGRRGSRIVCACVQLSHASRGTETRIAERTSWAEALLGNGVRELLLSISTSGVLASF